MMKKQGWVKTAVYSDIQVLESICVSHIYDGHQYSGARFPSVGTLARRVMQTPWLPRAIIGLLSLLVLYLVTSKPSGSGLGLTVSSSKGRGEGRAQVQYGFVHWYVQPVQPGW